MEIHVCVAWRKTVRVSSRLPPPPPTFTSFPFKWKYNHYVLPSNVIYTIVSWNVCTIHHPWIRFSSYYSAKTARLSPSRTGQSSSKRFSTLAPDAHPRVIFIIARYGECRTNTTSEWIYYVCSFPCLAMYIFLREADGGREEEKSKSHSAGKCPQHSPYFGSVSCTHVSSFHTNKTQEGVSATIRDFCVAKMWEKQHT